MQLEDKLKWFFKNKSLSENLVKAYDLSLIKSDRYDYLGEIYIDNVIGTREAGRKGQYLTPQNVVELMCAMTFGKKNYEKINVLDPCVGTGRFLLTANKYAPNANLFGVDIDLRAIRTAFTNAAIHSITMYLLNADSLRHETDISKEDGRYNWHFANRWYSYWDKLKEMTAERKEEVKKQLTLFR